jgi:squalene-hopene/tetraprenyl-beta-curcumene cyclase
MQLPDGGWSLYHTHSAWFPGRGSLARTGLIESSSPDMTGHALLALPDPNGRPGEAVQRGLRWLLGAQDRAGRWAAQWGCYYIFGTAAAVEALVLGGVPASHQVVRRGVSWLLDHQNDDGGWGESVQAVLDESWAGRGESTVSQTSWALLALIPACGPDHQAVRRGVAFLLDRYRAQAHPWAEPQHTWVVIPQYLYWIDTLMRLVYPLWALARYQQVKNAVAVGSQLLEVGP